MSEEAKFDREKLMRPHVYITYDHGDKEYKILNLPNGLHGAAQNIPTHWEGVCGEKLGKEWRVENRGTRLEIKTPDIGDKRAIFSTRERNEQTDSAVRAVLQGGL